MEIAHASYPKALPSIGGKEENAQLRQKTDEFEAIIVKMMLDEAMKEEKNLFTAANDPGDKIFKSMYREELSNASAGSFGFSQMLYEHLSQKGEQKKSH